MQTQTKVLLIEDQPTDAELASRELKRAGIDHYMVRVDTKDEFLRSIDAFRPDVILSDFSMPHFDGLAALGIARDKVPDTPFIFVSGTIGEEVAIESLKRGAVDYILKTNLKRLGPAVKRALDDVGEKRARLAAERQLNESRMRFELFMRYLPGAAFIKDTQGRYQFVNWSWEEMTGRKAADVLNRTDGELWPELAPQYEQHDRMVFDNNEASRRTVTFPQRDGVHHYLVQKFPIHDHEGSSTLVGGIAVDLTDRLRAEEKIARLSRIHAVLSGINSTIVRVSNRDELFREACRIAVEHGGFRLAWIGWLERATLEVKPVAWAGEASGYLARIRVSAREDLAEGRGIVGDAVRGGKPVIVNIIGNDPRMRYAEDALAHGLRSAVALPLQIGNQSVGAMTLYAADPRVFDQDEMKLLAELAGDISFALDHIAKAERLNYLAYFDALTGLPNREMLLDYLRRVVRRTKEEKTKAAVVMCDIQRFSHINETLGRQTGDALLRELGQRLKGLWPEPDNLARVSANCFAGIVANIKDASEVAHLIEKPLADALNRPFEAGTEKLRISVTSGIAVSPFDGADADVLLKNAEAALKRAKSRGERYLFYHPEMNSAVAETLLLENKLRGALEKQEFVLHYQPKIDLAGGHISGLEALIRWNDPGSGLVAPGKFIPLLEETGMIIDTGTWAIHKALADHREWHGQGLRPPSIAVNVSPIQLRQRGFVDAVGGVIKESKADPRALAIEITESLLMDDVENNIRKLQTLRDMGVSIAIDDFGTGYSSLGYLARLPVDALKIDRSFINTMASSPDSMTIVSTIISLAHSLNMKVIAEGVESEEQSRLLKLLKCDEVQGYLFSKPLPFPEIQNMICSRK